MVDYPCRHDGDGYLATVENHHGAFDAWVCGDCGNEVPIDRLAPSRQAQLTGSL